MSSGNGEERAGFLPTALAALVGTTVGNAIHKLVIARRQSEEEDEEQELVVTSVAANTLMATFLARGRPRKAFLLGVGMTISIGDVLDRALLRLFLRR